jgi:hypothetical protein
MAAKRREKAQRPDDYPASFLCLLCLFVAIHCFGCGFAAPGPLRLYKTGTGFFRRSVAE